MGDAFVGIDLDLRVLDAAVAAITSDLCYILELDVRLADIEHRTIDEGILVSLVRKGEQCIGTLEALRQHAHIVVHEKDMRRIPVESCNHATGKAARPADIGIRNHGHPLIGERLGVEGTPIVDQEHVEAGSDGILRAQDFLLHGSEFARDVALLAEGGGGEHKTYGTNRALIDFGLVGAAAEHGRSPETIAKPWIVACRSGRGTSTAWTESDAPTFRTGCAALRLLPPGFQAGREDLAGIARKLEPDHEILRDGTAAPLLDREAVQIGREVDRPFEGDCPYLRIVGSLSSPSCQ